MSKLRERFDKKGFGVSKYARAHGMSHATLSLVLDGKLTGTNASSGGKVRKVFVQLKQDGVYIGRLPWEKKERAGGDVC